MLDDNYYDDWHETEDWEDEDFDEIQDSIDYEEYLKMKLDSEKAASYDIDKDISDMLDYEPNLHKPDFDRAFKDLL